MNRKNFIQQCGMACLSSTALVGSAALLTGGLSGCAGTKHGSGGEGASVREGRGSNSGNVADGGDRNGGRASRKTIGRIEGDDLVLALSAFRIGKEAATDKFRPSVIVHPEILRFPVVIYRFTAEEYSAVWMQCTHQGAELQAFGSMLQCPAHGSEFNGKGQVTSGPAATSLRTFPVRIENDQLKISLKAI